MLKAKIAVVILNWNGKVFLEEFLPSVIKNSACATIYIADNDSNDDSISFLELNYPDIKIIKNEINSGFSEGYNVALKKIDSEYYILLNSDVQVTPHWIEPIIELMDSDKTIAACQPKILDYKNKTYFEYAGACGGYIDKYGYPFCRGRIFNYLEKDNQQYNQTTEIFWATGACMFVRSSHFWEVDGFDKDYFAHMEEIDLCWRMKNLGHKIYIEPKSTVYHVGGGTLNKINPKKTFLNFRNNLVTLLKNSYSNHLVIKIIYRMILDAVAAFKFLIEGNGKHFIAVIKAHIKFYMMLPSTLRKRALMKQKLGFEFTKSSIFQLNIVYFHFIKRIKTFSEIEKHLNK